MEKKLGNDYFKFWKSPTVNIYLKMSKWHDTDC